MYMRMLHARLKPGSLSQLRDYYVGRVIPVFQRTTGCLYAGLMQSTVRPDECISMTLWRTSEDAEAYGQSEIFHIMVNEIKVYLSESSEYTIRLSEDLTLECVPVSADPEVETYEIEATAGLPEFNPAQSDKLWLRTVRMKIAQGKVEEFKRIYRESIIPSLREVKGCNYVYLTQRPGETNEATSVTVWSSREDAEAYEQGGLYEKLVELLRPTLSGLYQWKMDREKRVKGGVASSEDVAVEYYDILAARAFA
jgi:quinol monooxygenase YgiN